jgi:hypothetical protein
MQNLIGHLKARLEKLLVEASERLPKSPTTNHARDEGERAPHEYELYYWSSAPGPWY